MSKIDHATRRKVIDRLESLWYPLAPDWEESLSEQEVDLINSALQSALHVLNGMDCLAQEVINFHYRTKKERPD